MGTCKYARALGIPGMDSHSYKPTDTCILTHTLAHAYTPNAHVCTPTPPCEPTCTPLHMEAQAGACTKCPLTEEQIRT